MTCARCRRCSRPAGGEGENEDAVRPSVRLVTKKRKGRRPWHGRGRRRRRDNVRCMLGARAGHRRPPAPVRPPFCGYVVRTSLARFGCSGMTSSSIGKCTTSSERREVRRPAMTARVFVSLARTPNERPHELMIFLSESNISRRTGERTNERTTKERKREENYYSAVAVDWVGESRATAFPARCPGLPSLRCPSFLDDVDNEIKRLD